MEERAAGEFDKYKDDQYEEFWGQKQKLAYDVVAGDMTNLKLSVLVKAGLYRVGDIWSFARVFGRSERVLVEKDVAVSSRIAVCYFDLVGQTNTSQITAIDDGNLTFSIPPGQRKFPIPREITALTIADRDETIAEDEDTIRVSSLSDQRPPDTQPTEGPQPTVDTRATEGTQPTEDTPIIFTLEAPQSGPQALERTIIQIDGRIESPPNGNAWKAIRCKRDNQDMGSLWEMREQFYVRQSAKKTRVDDDEDSEYESPRQKRLKARK